MPLGPLVNEDYPLVTFPNPPTLDAVALPFKGTIPGGIYYNSLLIDLNGTLTASGGAAAGYGTADIIDRFSLYVARNEVEGGKTEYSLIDNVRFFTLVQWSRDFGFITPQTDAGSGGGAATLQVLIPLGLIKPDDKVRFQGMTQGAIATFHTTATAFSLNMALYPLIQRQPESAEIKGLLGYKENIMDVVASAAQPTFQLLPGPPSDSGQVWALGCAFVIRNESARGTLADGWDASHLIIGGQYPVGQSVPERIHKVRWAYKRRLASVAGLMPMFLNPKVVTDADQIFFDNEATATVAGTSTLYVYHVTFRVPGAK